MIRPDWKEYALAIAEAVALRSEDPYVKVGAVVMRHDMSVASVGYNGLPPGVEIDFNDRDARRPFVIHAEMNALRYATRTDTLYGLLAITHRPCVACLPMIAAYGFELVVYENELSGAHDNVEMNRIARALKLNVKKIRRSEHVGQSLRKTGASAD